MKIYGSATREARHRAAVVVEKVEVLSELYFNPRDAPLIIPAEDLGGECGGRECTVQGLIELEYHR